MTILAVERRASFSGVHRQPFRPAIPRRVGPAKRSWRMMKVSLPGVISGSPTARALILSAGRQVAFEQHGRDAQDIRDVVEPSTRNHPVAEGRWHQQSSASKSGSRCRIRHDSVDERACGQDSGWRQLPRRAVFPARTGARGWRPHPAGRACGGIMPTRTFGWPFSQTEASAGTLARSSVSNITPAVFAR